MEQSRSKVTKELAAKVIAGREGNVARLAPVRSLLLFSLLMSIAMVITYFGLHSTVALYCLVLSASSCVVCLGQLFTADCSLPCPACQAEALYDRHVRTDPVPATMFRCRACQAEFCLSEGGTMWRLAGDK